MEYSSGGGVGRRHAKPRWRSGLKHSVTKRRTWREPGRDPEGMGGSDFIQRVLGAFRKIQ